MIILTFEEYTTIVDTTDKTQREKFNKIYVDVEETYLREILTTPVFDKVKDGTYTATNKPTLFRLMKRCAAKKIESIFVKMGTSQLTVLGLVQRQNEYSNPSEIGQVKMKLDAIYEVLRSYENQLTDELANITEYVSPLYPISTQAPFVISASDSARNKYHSQDYYQECLCKKDTGHYPT